MNGKSIWLVCGIKLKLLLDYFKSARNEELGLKTVDELKSMGLTANFHQLDIDCETSRKNLKEYLQNKYGGLDVLINNAGIAFKVGFTDMVVIK